MQAVQSGSLQVKTTGAVDNQQGSLTASRDVRLNAQALNNDNGLISAAAGTGRIKHSRLSAIRRDEWSPPAGWVFRQESE